jgi:hypothetical protein
VNRILPTKACEWCRKEAKTFLVFLKPKGWIKHKTSNDTDMLFCSLACFKAFTGIRLTRKSKPTEMPVEAQEAQLLATLAR